MEAREGAQRAGDDSEGSRGQANPTTDDASFARLTMFMALSGQCGPGDFARLMGTTTPAESNKEKERIAERLGGFNSKDNVVWKEITHRFGSNLKQPELLSIAHVLASHAGLKLDRDAKRRKSVLVKWFDEHWSQLCPYLDYVVLEDARV
jgi:hypothetical protein